METNSSSMSFYKTLFLTSFWIILDHSKNNSVDHACDATFIFCADKSEQNEKKNVDFCVNCFTQLSKLHLQIILFQKNKKNFIYKKCILLDASKLFFLQLCLKWFEPSGNILFISVSSEKCLRWRKRLFLICDCKRKLKMFNNIPFTKGVVVFFWF